MPFRAVVEGWASNEESTKHLASVVQAFHQLREGDDRRELTPLTSWDLQAGEMFLCS